MSVTYLRCYKCEK